MIYEPICKKNQIIIGTGTDVIVTGWLPAKVVSKELDKTEYAAIGQLYNAERGINFLLRNILANPQVTRIVAIAATKEDRNAKSVEALKHCWDSGDTTGLDKDLRRYFPTLRETVKCLYFVSAKEAIEYVRNNKPEVMGKREKIVKPEPQRENKPTKPASRYVHKIEARTIAEAWVKLLHQIRINGTVRPTGYDGTWQELIDLCVVVTDEPEGCWFPEPNYLSCTRETLTGYVPQILEDAPYKQGVKYTYGQRIHSWFGKNQFAEVINKLEKEIDSASAVINLWDSGTGDQTKLIESGRAIARYGRSLGDSDHNHGGSPCLNHIWFRVVNGVLSMTAMFRSNDMFSAWPFNAMGLRILQEKALDELKQRGIEVKMGPLITISQSAHIYDDCNDNADKVIKDQYQKIIREFE